MSGKLVCADGTVVQISRETENELRKAFELKPESKFGDIVVYTGRNPSTRGGKRRVLLYDSTGKLWPYNIYVGGQPRKQKLAPLSDYTLLGENIFTDDLLDLR